MSRSKQPIYSVAAKTHTGTTSTVRTQQLGSDSFVIDEGVLSILTQFLLDYANRRNEFYKNGRNRPPASGKFAPSGFTTINWIRILNIALGFGSSNSLGNLQQVAAAHLVSSDNNAGLKTKFFRLLGLEHTQVDLLHPAKPTLFPVIPIHPNQLIEAILHADEKMVRDLLNANPELLLKEGTSKDYQGRTFTGTPLQAAIATGDVAPNRNSTGLVEIILEHLKKLKKDTYQDIFEQQAREIYEKSLSVCRDMQSKKIARLCQLSSELEADDPQQAEINTKIQKAQKNVREYTKALCGHDLETLFKTHKKAQADNTFDFKPYVKAILDIDLNDPQLADVMALIDADVLAFSEFSDDEIQVFKQAAKSVQARNDRERQFVAKINSMMSGGAAKFDPWEVRWLMGLAEKTGRQDLSDSLQEKIKIKIKTATAIVSAGVGPKESDDCRNKSFDQLTLVQKLNRFREQYVLHKKQEIIDNPHDILQALKHNEDARSTTLLHHQDSNYHKRMVIFSQLVGWAQRHAAESMKQDIRQGTWYLTEKNEQRTRQPGFNEVDSGWTVENIRRSSLVDVSLADSSIVNGFGYKFAAAHLGCAALLYAGVLGPCSKLVSSKNSKLGEIYTAVCAQARERQPVRSHSNVTDQKHSVAISAIV